LMPFLSFLFSFLFIGEKLDLLTMLFAVLIVGIIYMQKKTH